MRTATPNTTLQDRKPALSSNPDRAMQEMMSIIDRLRGIYVRENEALIAADTQTFLSLQDEKLSTAREYQLGAQHMMEHRDDIRTASAGLKDRLIAMQQEFAHLSETNMESIRRMQRCTERLGETIMNAAREEMRKNRVVNYAETGIMAASERKTVSMGSINETA